MPNAEHVAILRSGRSAINAYCSKHKGVVLNLQQADLRGVNLNGVHLTNASFEGANLQDTDLREASLSDITFSKANLRNAQMQGTNLSNVDFSEACLIRANFRGSEVRELNFQRANLHEADLQNLELDEQNLQGANLSNANMFQISLISSNLAGANLQRANLESAAISRSNLEGANLVEANLYSANLCYANIREGNLMGAKCGNANFSHATLSDIKIDSATDFSTSMFFKTKIDRFSVDYLADAVHPRKILDMEIVDDIATLRGVFSGIWGWLHVFGLCLFLLPYMVFLFNVHLESRSRLIADSAIEAAKQWVKLHRASDVPAGDFDAAASKLRQKYGVIGREEISLMEALWNFVRSGGVGARNEVPTSRAALWRVFFVFVLQVSRTTLLLKTKKLETEESVRRLPVRFHLRGKWWLLFCIERYGRWLAYILIGINTWAISQSVVFL